MHEKIRNIFRSPVLVLRLCIGVILAVVFAAGIFHFVLGIELESNLPKRSLCIFTNLSGKPCPGCGMTRAFLMIGRLKIIQALQMNPLSLPLFLLMLIYFFSGQVPRILRKKQLINTVLLFVLVFWLFRLI